MSRRRLQQADARGLLVSYSKQGSHITQDRHLARFAAPRTAITEDPAGPWPRWAMARAAAIEHLREHVAKCQKTLVCLRRAGCFQEYILLRGEMAECEESNDIEAV